MKRDKVVGIIPARGGSVGVPLKNIRNLGGKPLISYTIEAAIESKVLDRIIVSTDHEGIAEVAEQYGAEVPFVRPPDISEDVETELVLQHAVNFLEEDGLIIDGVVLLPSLSMKISATITALSSCGRNEQRSFEMASGNMGTTISGR